MKIKLERADRRSENGNEQFFILDPKDDTKTMGMVEVKLDRFGLRDAGLKKIEVDMAFRDLFMKEVEIITGLEAV